MSEQTNEIKRLKQYLWQLHAYALGYVFTDDEAEAKAMPTSQRFAAIGGLLTRLAAEGVIDSPSEVDSWAVRSS